MSTYEMSLSLSSYSTSPKARDSLSVADAAGNAAANLRYITRESAVDAEAGDLIHHHAGEAKAISRAEASQLGREELEKRAARHNPKTGVRLCDKLTVSLPADASPEQHREMVKGILGDLGGDSEAHLIAAIHRDRAGNPHVHIWALDGRETREAAQARRPDAKRVRQGDHLRLNEGGKPKEVRARIAAAINEIADRHDGRRAEHRSFKDRGIERTPQIHEGIEAGQKWSRPGVRKRLSKRTRDRVKTNLDAFKGTVANWREAGRRVPRRWRKRLGQEWWAAHLGLSTRMADSEPVQVEPITRPQQASEPAHRSETAPKPPTPSTAVETPARGAPEDAERRKAALEVAKERARHTPHPPPVIEPRGIKSRSRTRSR